MPYVDVDRSRGRIAIVTLNRPERLNALSASMVSDIKAAFAGLTRDRDVAVVVLTGAGAGFCAGADLSGEPDPAPDTEGRGQMLRDDLRRGVGAAAGGERQHQRDGAVRVGGLCRRGRCQPAKDQCE